MTEFFTIGAICILAVISPGPDFVLITRSALCHSRNCGFVTAIGIATGNLVHVTYSIAGIGLIISKSIVAYTVLKYLGAAYLIYIGWKCLRSKASVATTGESQEITTLPKATAFRIGFLTNLLNAKCSLFFVALFSQVLGPGTAVGVQAAYGLMSVSIALVWFSLLAYVISLNAVRSTFQRIQNAAEKVMGALLIIFGVKIAFSKN